MFSGFETQERRRGSMTYLSTNEKWRPRSASTGVLEVSPVSNFYSQRGPATPCFVSPRMAFSTQFNYDSPLQVLTSSSPGVFIPMSVPKIPRRYTLRRLPLKCKALLTTLLLSLALCLYVFRNSVVDGSIDCNLSGTCENHTHDHSNLQRFVRAVAGPGPAHHTLTRDLDNPEIGSSQVHGNYEELELLNQRPDLTEEMYSQQSSSQQGYNNGNPIAVIIGKHVEPSEGVGNDRPSLYSPVENFEDFPEGNYLQEGNYLHEGQADYFSSLESAPLAVLPPNMPAETWEPVEYIPQGIPQGIYRENLHNDQGIPQGMYRENLHNDQGIPQGIYMENRVYDHGYAQAPQMGDRQGSEREYMVGMAEHSGPYWRDSPLSNYHEDSSNRHGQVQFGYRETNDHNQHRRSIENLRLDRLPPGVNPRRYLEL